MDPKFNPNQFKLWVERELVKAIKRKDAYDDYVAALETLIEDINSFECAREELDYLK